MQKFRRTRYGLAITLTALCALGLTTGMSPYKSVDVVAGSRTVQTGTYASESVGTFLAHRGFHVHGYDLVEPARATLLHSGMKIVVKWAKTVYVKDGAKPVAALHTLAPTVGKLLHRLGIHLRQQDTVNVPLEHPITEGMRVVVTRHETLVSTDMIVLPYVTVRESSSRYDAGTDATVRSGRDGLMREVIRKEYSNGKLVAKRESRRVIRKPVDELVDVGTAQPAPVIASRSASSLVTNESLTAVATAYANPGGFTATGAPAGYGDIAVDPSVIPLGTKLYVPGYGYGVADDTGGAIQGYRIDLCFDSVSQALSFGRQVVKVYILGQN
ncbi:MAG: 3D domain-containing protein [Firmicutes bacterium]|nr:3D domain-containing protein [Bacillota bacterium]